MGVAFDQAGSTGKTRLRAEFLLFYIGVPLVTAVFLPPSWMFPVLFAMTGGGLVLLAVTPGFHWRELAEGSNHVSWRLVLIVGLATAILGTVIIQWTAPQAFLFLIRTNPQLMLMIALLYPILSALPQEIVFRPLFFRRYGPILPAQRSRAILLNSGIFSFAHLMYWSWIVAAMTFVGGLIFAKSYRVRGSFAEAVIAHSVAGVVIFALGLGVFFYSGNVTRPF